ncbi:MAG: hypothetical protein HOP19_00245, partial [Acidobacteria bacterium]|nr:hypothetical protein [Acidobacteriota bacterium]
SYNQTLTQSGASAPLTWNLAAGTLPNGVNLSASGGLSGTPTTAGTFNFTVQVVGASNCSTTKAYSVTIACPSGGCGGGTTATGTISASPNPIQVCDGTGLGATTLTWTTTGATTIQIRLGSATGEILYQGTSVNAAGTTDKWVTNGMEFFLLNAANGATLASTTVLVTSDGCGGGGTGASSLTIAPNPLIVCDGTGLGVATLSWSTTVTSSVQIRRLSPTGPLMALGRSRGSVRTGKYVADGMLFYLLTSSGNVLASVRASVTSNGCALITDEGEHPFALDEGRSITPRRDRTSAIPSRR